MAAPLTESVITCRCHICGREWTHSTTDLPAFFYPGADGIYALACDADPSPDAPRHLPESVSPA